MVRLANQTPQSLAASRDEIAVAKLQMNAPCSPKQDSEISGSFLSAHSKHNSSDDLASEADENDEDDSLADFIVSDDADEDELRRGSPRRRQAPAPPRPRRRRMIVESDSEDDDGQDESLELPPKKGGEPIIYSEDETDDLVPQVVSLRLSSPGVREVLGDLPSSPNAVAEPTKVSTKPKRGSSQIDDMENGLEQADLQDFADSEPEASLVAKARKPRSGARTKSKSAAAEKQRQRAFANIRGSMAQQWLDELDATITDGQLAQRTALTGGVAIVWSTRMRQTAGQAMSRRKANGELSCTITLSSSLINDEDRLYNTVAHEFAHLAVGLQMGKPKPHGPEFFAIGAAIAAGFPARHIVFGRCHRYDVKFKYAWQCTGTSTKAESASVESGCGAIFQRHSKSLDIVRMRCGRCRGRLIQIRPAPDTKSKGLSTYQGFVKEKFAEVKRKLESQEQNSSAKEVMREVSRLWKIEKETQAESSKQNEKSVDDLDELDEELRQLDLQDEVWTDTMEEVAGEGGEGVVQICDDDEEAKLVTIAV